MPDETDVTDEPGATSPDEPAPAESGDQTAEQVTAAISPVAPVDAGEALKADKKDAAAGPDDTAAGPPARGPDDAAVSPPAPGPDDATASPPAPEPDNATGSPPEPDDAPASLPEPEDASDSPPEPEDAPASPPEPDDAPASPPEPDNATASPSEPDDAPASPPEPDNATASPSEPDDAPASPPEPDNATASPSEPDDATAPPPERDNATAPPPEPEDAPAPPPVAAATDEATVALATSADPQAAPPHAASVEPAAAPGGLTLTRRQLLTGLSGVAGAALVGGAVALHSATNGTDKTPVRSKSASPALTKPRKPESTTIATPPAPVQSRPIYTLAEYRKATSAPPFPADAIALTIDDGPHPIWTPKILRLLDKYHVPAIFCMIGNQVLGHENVAQTVTRAGHQLANHTWSHPTHLSRKPRALVRNEIHKAQTKIQKTTGYAPKLFRSPGGDWSPQLLHEVAQAGLFPLDWSVDPRDWSRPGVPTIERRLLAAHPGQILLCHDGGGDRSQTYKSLSVVIPTLKARGLHFAALHG